MGQGERGPQLLPKQPQSPSFCRQEGCPDPIFPLDGKHCLQNSLLGNYLPSLGEETKKTL